MIVYRKNEKTVPYTEAVDGLLARIKRMESDPVVSHEDVQDLLIEWGEFESAVTDLLFPAQDSVSEITGLLRKVSIYTGHLLAVSWDRKKQEALYWLDMLKGKTSDLRDLGIKGDLKIREQEGYAHYGLYPETYLEAARAFYRDLGPSKAVCIGLRSIGASLSCVVGAALERCGCEVSSYTLRPQGHPFERGVNIDKRLSEKLKGYSKAFFLVIDEGPGKSGTSLCGAASGLSGLGIPDDRIVIFPSWNPDGVNFLSHAARERWTRHRRYAGDFNKVWIDSGRLYEGFPEGEVKEVSAGMWRRLFYSRQEDYPCVHPYHEKRKFLVTADGNGEDGFGGGKSFLCRFAGLGRYGKGRFERARILDLSGMVPRPMELRNGFMVTEFVEGRPLVRGEVNQILLERIAGYMNYIGRNLPDGGRADFSMLHGMISRNISIGLGQEWSGGLEPLERFRDDVESAPTAFIDGRMLPHEWLLTRRGYIKADSFDHSTDQFFPRSQDAAWDIAGAIIEFELTPMQTDYLLTAYEAASRGDGLSIRKRLPFYFIAYSSYRLGYTVFASQELRGTPDGKRFDSGTRFYSDVLRKELAGLGCGPAAKRDRTAHDNQN